MGTLAHDSRVKLQQMRHKLKLHHRAEINQEHINRVKKIMAHFLLCRYNFTFEDPLNLL